MRRLGVVLVLAVVCSGGWSLTAGPLEESRRLYETTRYEEALKTLKSAPSGHAKKFLEGQILYRMEKYKEAVECFEEALAGQPGSARYANWLGKAWGRRAETSIFLKAPAYAGKARDYFEKAVELDGKDLEAISDLFDYYLAAPGFLGGGEDKAAKLAEQAKPISPAEYAYFQARLSEKRKELSAAEKQYRQALALEPETVGRYLDLASFLYRNGKQTEAEQLFTRAGRLEPANPRVGYARAKQYLEARHNREEAVRLLEQYLKAPLTPEDPPREEARKLLEQARRG